MKRNTTLLVLLLLVFFAKAQEYEMKPVTIPHSPVGFLGMAQDKFGYIWLADNGNGLFRYDGKETYNYKPEPANPNSLSSGRIENVFIDRDGILWLPTFESGLDRFDSETEIFTHFRHDDQDTTTICSNGVRDIVEDTDGNLWVGTNLGLDKFDKKTGTFIHNFSNDPDAQILRSEHIRKLYIDTSGIIWIGTGSAFFGEETTGGLFSLNPRTGEIELYRHTEEENSLIDNRVRGIFEDSRGVFWIGTAGDGLHTMNRDAGTFTRHTYDPEHPEKLSRPPVQNILTFAVDHITFIGEDDKGGIWIGTFGNGLNHYDPSTEITNHYGPNETGTFKTHNWAYWDFFKTSDGLLWFASFYTTGTPVMLTKLDVTPQRLEFIESDSIYGVAEDGDNLLYLGTADGVQTLINGERNYLFKTYDSEGRNNHTVREITLDADGNIWAGTAGAGLFYYNRKTKALKNYRHQPGNANSLSNDFLGTILIRDNGEIFIGTSDGLDIFTPDKDKFEHFELKNANIRIGYLRYPKFVSVDDQNRIWIAGSGGIFRFDRENSTFIKYELGLGNEIIRSIFKDADGVVWIATINHGLRRYDSDSDTFQPILDETGFLNKYSTVLFIGQDRNKAMWLASGTAGLIKYNLQNNQGTLFGEDWISESGRYDLNGIFTLSNGEILLGSQGGYYRFHPDEFVRSDSATQQPFIQKLIINNTILGAAESEQLYESFRVHSSIELSYDQNDLSFMIGYIDLENNQGSQSISYKLENYDREWRYTSSGSLASYYQLLPGKYNLKIKAQDIYGNWGEKNLSIVIAPPWYRTVWAYFLYGLIVIGGIILVDRYQRTRLLKKARAVARAKELEQAKKIKKAYDQLELAHTELKNTQSQLIQSEKMASLGELTAGIAHEIQNPLNFVNNFSEVSGELVDEIGEEIAKGNLREVKEISGDLRQNLDKINHHGRRASAIVKAMLEHSRSGDGEKEPADINAMADEYLRLAYHGLRAKDKSFNADFSTDLDETIPKINVVPQDIGRVLLNLINNAFYAVSSKAALNTSTDSKYKPKVKVSTRFIYPTGGDPDNYRNWVEICVEDNGSGIPVEKREKIFEPFYTTKPTGQGTGLGLSLSYDIIQSHGGTLRVEANVTGGASFIIKLQA